MSVLSLVSKGVHMVDNSLSPAAATAAEHGEKGSSWWKKFVGGLDRVEDFVDNVTNRPIKVQTQSSIDKGTTNQLLIIGLAVVAFFFLIRKAR